MPAPFRISAKTLGEIALDKFCARCFWRKIHVSKMPFQIFPGIFSSIDSYTKRVVHSALDEGTTPAYLSQLGDVVGYVPAPHSSRFNIHDDATDILLTGLPDDVFVLRDQSHIIVDYKTARFTRAADALFPLYDVQLNVYAMIAERVGPKPVSALALIYMEPQTDEESAREQGSHHKSGFAMKFSAHVQPVEIKPAIIPPLLHRSRALFDATEPPPSRDGCSDCVTLGQLFQYL